MSTVDRIAAQDARFAELAAKIDALAKVQAADKDEVLKRIAAIEADLGLAQATAVPAS